MLIKRVCKCAGYPIKFMLTPVTPKEDGMECVSIQMAFDVGFGSGFKLKTATVAGLLEQ